MVNPKFADLPGIVSVELYPVEVKNYSKINVHRHTMNQTYMKRPMFHRKKKTTHQISTKKKIANASNVFTFRLKNRTIVSKENI